MRAQQSAGQQQRKLLARLLRRAAHTAIGKEYDFASIGSYEEFAGRVPQMPYPALRPYIDRMLAGEADVLVPGRCRRFAQSSGTSDGKSKYIPLPEENLQKGHYAGAAFSLASYLHCHPRSRVFGGKNLILGGSFANELTLPDCIKVGDLSASLIDRINPLVNLFRTPSKETALLEDWHEKLPRLTVEAVKTDVRSLSGVPSWMLGVMEEAMKMTGTDSITRIWPNLEVFFHGGIAFGPYREQYRRITLPDGINYWENYNASEGFIACQSRPDAEAMQLLLTTDIFYEFIPLSDPDASPIPLEAVTEGEIYALLITSSNGLYRYPIGDTIRIERVSPTVEITITGRTKHYINAFGEEVMVYNADAALAKACTATGAEAADYTVAPVFASDGRKGHHQWLIEFTREPDDLKRFTAELDGALQQENSDYQAKRFDGIFLAEPEVIVAPRGIFDRWLAATGKLGGQRKVPRLSNDRRVMDQILLLADQGNKNLRYTNN